jgi:GlpG protein
MTSRRQRDPLRGGSAVEQNDVRGPPAANLALVTPIFVHVNPWHPYSTWWFYDLARSSSAPRFSRFAIMVLVIALVSNVSEFVVSGPMFAGMSGVVYGLFGYAWVRGRLNPTSGLYLRPDVAVWMMAWFALCFVMPGMNVANTAHAAGLACGAAIGAFVHGIHLWQRNKNT